MGFISISYDGGTYHDDDDNLVGEPPKNVSIKVTTRDKLYEFNSGNVIKDWYDMKKKILNGEIVSDTGYFVHSSTVDHFFMDGALVDSGYLHIIDDKPVLKYHDRSDPNWWKDASVEKGFEFFVPENTTPTWEELRKLCNDEVGYFYEKK